MATNTDVTSPPEFIVGMPEPEEFAVALRSVHLSYGSNVHVLNGLTLEIPRGTIYGLLGPSGCGKTSLIRCILGTLKCSSGDITVFGQRPGDRHSMVPGAGVGYMPQDITLYDDLSISETLSYFGTLLGMSSTEVDLRTQFLVNLLALPDIKRLVRQLSGGQKRRVSLATALIHNPPLLVLDEPTVGVDPLLRETIWRHLIERSQRDQFTTLITTHYIEEARHANRVGMMRDGRMLAQDTPAALVDRYQLPSLENVFLNLCQQAEEGETKDRQQLLQRQNSNASTVSSGVDSIELAPPRDASPGALPPPPPQAKPSKPVEPVRVNQVGWWCQVPAIVSKNVNSIRRNRVLMLFQFLLPTIQVILFCACVGHNMHSIPLAVFDGDKSDFSQRILGALDPRIIHQQLHQSAPDAIDAVRKGKASSALTISGDFSFNLFERMASLGNVSSEAMYNSTLHIFPDMSNQLSVMAVQKEVTRAFFHVGREFLREIGSNQNMLSIPIQTEEPVYGQTNPIYRDFMAPGTILSIAFLSSIPSCCVSIPRCSLFFLNGAALSFVDFCLP